MIRIGLLGASRIARGAVIKPASDIDGCTVVRVAARDRDRAREYAEEHGIAGIEPDYAALVASDDVDLVYNALPPSGHAEWTIAALKAGKDVLCEKPFAMNADEAEQMANTAEKEGRVLIEAFHYRFHPLFKRVLEMLEAGEVGAIESVDAHFNVPIKYSGTELRYRPELGGGAMMDLGCYPLHWVRSVVGEEPEVVSADATPHESGVDLAMRAELTFPGGVTAAISSAMGGEIDKALSAELIVRGERGELRVDNPIAPHDGHSLTLVRRGLQQVEKVPGQTTYHHQLEHVLAVLAGEAEPICGGADAVNTMRAIDEIYRQAMPR